MYFWKLLKNRVVNVFTGICDPELPLLPIPCPPFSVTGLDESIQACGVYTTIVLSLTQCQKALAYPIIRWPALCPLVVNPCSGKMFNAYYDRYFLNFFYNTDLKTGEIVYTCDSTDVVAHELGHAILDALRPDLWAIQSVEIQAFHEAFADINAMLTELTRKPIVELLLRETDGNLKLPNCVANIGEQMWLAIYRTGEDIPANFTLRSALNEYNYSTPENLPVGGEELTGEPHSFSKVFLGGWYDTFVNIYQQERSHQQSDMEAIVIARDKIAAITYNAIRTAPVTTRFFGSVVKAMLTYDQRHGGKYQTAIREGFKKHDIKPSHLNATPPFELDDLTKFTIGINETTRITDLTDDSDDPFFDCIVEVANARGAVDNLKKTIVATKYSLNVIENYERVSMGPTIGKIHEKEFSVIDGRLVRNYYSCWFHK